MWLFWGLIGYNINFPVCVVILRVETLEILKFSMIVPLFKSLCQKKFECFRATIRFLALMLRLMQKRGGNFEDFSRILLMLHIEIFDVVKIG